MSLISFKLLSLPRICFRWVRSNVLARYRAFWRKNLVFYTGILQIQIKVL